MSCDSMLKIWENRSHTETRPFSRVPEIGMSVFNETQSVFVYEPITPTTGAQLRALADEADSLWKEWEEFERGRKAEAGEVKS